MAIRLTEEQWANVVQGSEVPVRVSDPAESVVFVLVSADAYERFKSLFEEDPVTEQERLFQLQQFGKRAGWDDPEMDVYEERGPRRKTEPPRFRQEASGGVGNARARRADPMAPARDCLNRVNVSVSFCESTTPETG